MADLFRTSIGALIEVNLNFVLTGNTGVTLIIKKSDNSIVNWIATVDNAVTGVVSYVVKDGDLSVTGTYYLQPVVTFVDKKFFGEKSSFEVRDILC